MTTENLYSIALAADEAWSAELHRLFGKNAGDVRYTRRGHGEPGSELRRLHDAKLAADEALRASCAASRALWMLEHERAKAVRNGEPDMSAGYGDVFGKF
jgi:hypothetical protein